MATALIITLAQEIFCLLLSCLSLWCALIMILRNKALTKTKQFSPIMKIYFVYIFVFSFATIFHQGYLVFYWSSEESKYDARIIFVVGIVPWVILCVNSIVEFFLCFERCLIIIFPILYSDDKKRKYAILALTVIFFVIISLIYVNKVVDAYPSQPETLCRFISCIIKNTDYSVYLRMFSVVLNVLIAAWLLLLIKCSLKAKNEKTKRMNKTVLFMTTFNIVFELVPIVSSQVFVLVSFLTSFIDNNRLSNYPF